MTSRTAPSRAHQKKSTDLRSVSVAVPAVDVSAQQEDRATRHFFAQVAKSRAGSLDFLKAAGILTASGVLAKPYKG